MKGRALAKNEVKHDIFDHLSVVQIFLAGSFVAIRLTAAYPYENSAYFIYILYLFFKLFFFLFFLYFFSIFKTILKLFFTYFKPIILKQKIAKK